MKQRGQSVMPRCITDQRVANANALLYNMHGPPNAAFLAKNSVRSELLTCRAQSLVQDSKSTPGARTHFRKVPQEINKF
jgi:hypothetical protein